MLEGNKQKSAYIPKSPASMLVLLFALLFMISLVFSGCGENKLIVGQWNMTKVLVGEKEYDAGEFLDPTGQTDGTFVISFYGDETLIATGSLGTNTGASDGNWKKETENTFLITIDGQEREVKLVDDLLFMDIDMQDASIVVIFERQ